jgi:hypothetical protein
MGNKKKKIILIMIIQILLSLLDLVGIVLVGIVASISATGYRTRSPNEELNQIFSQFISHFVNEKNWSTIPLVVLHLNQWF